MMMFTVCILIGFNCWVLPTDEARSNEKGVLVHCLAGVSRSVTITVAYLMYKLSLNLNDAFNMVRARKSNIAPNFHFMQQLHNFECELARSPKDTPNPSQGILSMLVMFLWIPNIHIPLITVVVPVQCLLSVP